VVPAADALHSHEPLRGQRLTLSGTPAAVYALAAHPARGPSLRNWLWDRPAPSTAVGPTLLHSNAFIPSMAVTREIRARLPLDPAPARFNLTTRLDSSS